MANEKHLELIKQGVEAWNKWKEENPEEKVDLREADLREADLKGANLSEADLFMVDLSEADLSEANLVGARLSKTNLGGVNLKGAYLSGAVIDESTNYEGIVGCQNGVNGFWCEETDSAALMTLTPPGNSMQGSNPDAVIESLKRARRLHGFSMTLVGFVFLIAILGLGKIKFPNIDIELTSDRFGLLAMPMSIGILSLVCSFMADALKGARYLNDRQSAMTVGNFPWVLSKFAGGGRLDKLQSFITRFVMSFHPLFYLYYVGKWEFFDGKLAILNSLIFIIFLTLLLFFSGRMFLLSQSFQRPILFDTRTEEKRQDNLTKLTKAVETQTKAVETQTEAITELLDMLKPKVDSISLNSERKGTV